MATKLTQSSFLRDLPFRGLVISSLTMNIFAALLVLVLKGFLPPVSPLFYGRPSGEAQLIPTLGLMISPAVSFVIVLLNTALSLFVEQSFPKKILIFSAFLVSILSTITVLKIIFLVGFF